MRNPKPILLVEDSKKDIELALDALAEFNFANEIVVVRDGAAALDFLYRRGPYAAATGELPVDAAVSAMLSAVPQLPPPMTAIFFILFVVAGLSRQNYGGVKPPLLSKLQTVLAPRDEPPDIIAMLENYQRGNHHRRNR